MKAHGKAGVHPPFLYNLLDLVLTEKNRVPHAAQIEQLRRILLGDDREIDITDLGAGSRSGAKNRRRIRHIARYSAKPKKWGKTLYRLAAETKPKCMVELGTSLGMSAAYLASAAPKGKLFTLEGCPNLASEAKKNIDSLNLKNVEIRTGHFDHTLPDLLSELKSVDFAYVDGNHTEEATLRYFQWLKDKTHERTVLVFDDIHWSPGMVNAWQAICKDETVTLSVDLFRLGLIFFRSGLSQQHFNIVI
jgi:predicted O-methyltransferase YrrM